MKKAAFFLFSIWCIGIVNGQENFKVFYTDESKVSNYKFDKFIFAHNFFADAFFRTDLYNQLNANEMAAIIETVRQKISKGNAIKFEFPQKDKPNARLIFSIEPETKDGPIIILSTNFDQKTRKYTEDDTNHLVRWYFIKGNLVIYRKNLFSKEEEEKFIKENETGDLVELYMFDEIIQNNIKVEPLINQMLADINATAIQKLYGYLYQQEYFLSINKMDEAEKTNKELNEFYNKNEGAAIEKSYLIIKKMANAEFEIMKILH
ncbi:MAG: hypothetical protein CFE24_03020 [Flavobacterium sp. BFFFF2]|nr:MAG: hypothetical protein CFE24_03020 [Flavobacterium sp. BFFFF2]